MDGRSASTIDGICKSIVRFEEYNRFKGFATFNRDVKHLLGLRAERTGEAFSKATTLSTIKHLQAFFKWLALQDGYKLKIDALDIGYFNLPTKDTHIAQSRKLRPYPSLERIHFMAPPIFDGGHILVTYGLSAIVWQLDTIFRLLAPYAPKT